MKIKNSWVAVAVVALLTPCFSYGYNAETHASINKAIVKNQIALPNMMSLLDNLGYPDTNLQVNGKEIFKWFENAGRQEDSPFLRSANHFHEPISNSGFSGYWGVGLTTGESAPLWAQMAPRRQSPGGAFSWQDARQNFFSALISTDQASREIQLSDSFRAVGQVMHLSVPEHVRDTSHAKTRTYEGWVEDVAGRYLPMSRKYNATFDALLATPLYPDPPMLHTLHPTNSGGGIS